ncbi:hypothetical protein ACP70R_012790 [Stipagrostis hirtigluma subsp. patula]
MEGYSRDLLCGIGRGDAPPPEQRPRPPRVEMEEEVELSLGLSLGGRFGLERKGEKLARSSSVAAVLMTPVEAAAAASALARTSSLPAKAEAVKIQMLDGRSSGRESGIGVEPAARLPGSGSPSSASSDGEGQRLQDTLMRTSSLPAGFEDERKRKAAQSLRRLEVKKKRIERRNSLTCKVSKEEAGHILEEMNARTLRVESSNDVVMRNKRTEENVNHNNEKHPLNGLPPRRQVKFTSQECSSSVMPKRQNSVLKGTASAEEHSPSSAAPPLGEGANGAAKATTSFSPLAARVAALRSRGSQQHISGGAAARAKSMGDAERMMMQEMPCVSTKGLPNGNKVEGFLYKYRKGEEVRIVCVCHGSFLTPAEFVKHAGGGDVANPLRHIVVNPNQ